MKITIKITKEVLTRAAMCGIKNKFGENCAIALAIRDISTGAVVTYTEIFWDYYGPSEDESPLPVIAQDFISAFDKSTPEERIEMRPFSFEVDFPDSMIDKIGIDEAKRIIEQSETLEIAQ